MMVSRPLHLMVAAVLASTSSGRGALILALQDSVGLDGPVSTNVTLGSPREAGDVSTAAGRLARRHVRVHGAQSGMAKTEAHVCTREFDDGRIRRTYPGS